MEEKTTRRKIEVRFEDYSLFLLEKKDIKVGHLGLDVSPRFIHLLITQDLLRLLGQLGGTQPRRLQRHYKIHVRNFFFPPKVWVGLESQSLML